MRKAVFATLAGLAMLGCDPGVTQPEVEPDLSYQDGSPYEAGTRTYRVTVHNLTDSQPLTPPLVATHSALVRGLFHVGRPASQQIMEIAENGNLGPMVDALTGHPEVSNFVIAAGDPPPLLQGESITFEIEADGNAHFLSWVSMLICTNDGFAGRNQVRLPARMGHVRFAYARAYDAGTERNTEDFADIVPPCQIFGATSSDDEGTGMSDPALAEHGRVRPHRGIRGGADLDPELHGWDDPVAKIEVERIG